MPSSIPHPYWRTRQMLVVLGVTMLVVIPASAARGQEVIDLFESAAERVGGDDAAQGNVKKQKRGNEKKQKKKAGGGKGAAAITIEGADGAGVGGIEIGSAGDGTSDGGGRLTLKVDRRGSTYLVKVRIQGEPAYMIFDTGASYVSLTPSFARKVGVLPPRGAPEATMSTANGRAREAFGLLDRLDLGDRAHTRVTYVTCAGCAFGEHQGLEVVGLLGMNVLRRYRFDLDDARGEIRLTPNSHYANQRWDIEPWLQMGLEGMGSVAERMEIRLGLRNAAPHRVRELKLQVVCEQGGEALRSEVKTLSLEARGKSSAAIRIPRCDNMPRPEVLSARW